MKTMVGRLAIAAALGVAAWLSWSEAKLAARVADAKQQIATLQYGEVDEALPAGASLSDYLPGGQPRLADEVRVAKANVAYWLGRYNRVTAGGGDVAVDADVLLIAANAAFRESRRSAAAGQAAVQQLDGVLQAYASAMKAAPRAGVGAEAAFNYEYVARIRDQIARAPQGKPVKSGPPPAPAMAGDLPAGPTIHGRPGMPPPDAKMEELQMLAPMEFGDREAQPEATPGAKRERKG